MKRIFSLLAVVLACAATNLNAQDTAVKEEAETPNYRPFTLSVEASSTGPGLAADWRFADHFGARVGANGFLGLFDSEGLDVGHKEIEGINYEITLKPWMSEQLALDIYPWKKSTFRITAGVLLNQSKVEGDMPQSSSAGTFITVGSGIYQTSDFSLHTEIEHWPVCPFLSIGANFYLDEAKHWSVGGELGIAYTGSPDVTLVQGGPVTLNPADIEQERKEIEDAAWKVYPIVKVSVNYSF